MTPTETIILATYFFVLVILAIYGWHRYYLVYLYMKHKDEVPVPDGQFSTLPRVTIQLPLYNEMYVVDRLVEAVCKIEYPRELLEIQVLDDSTDETQEIAELAVRRFAAQGIDIKYIHRTDRTGYKAGALDAGHAGRERASSSRFSTPTSSRTPTSCTRTIHYFTNPQHRDGADAVGSRQRGLLAPDQDSGDPARRALRSRARRPQSRRLLLQLQRHRRYLAARGHRRRAAAGSTTR